MLETNNSLLLITDRLQAYLSLPPKNLYSIATPSVLASLQVLITFHFYDHQRRSTGLPSHSPYCSQKTLKGKTKLLTLGSKFFSGYEG